MANEVTIRHIVIDEIESEGFIDASSGHVMAAWSLNDAQWRREYMDNLIKYLGVKIEHVKGTVKERAKIAQYFNFELAP